MRLTRIYTFSAGHSLPSLPEGHKCRRPHGHNYRVEVTVQGEVGADGLLLEAGAMDVIVAPVLKRLDHYTLNDLGATLTTEPGQRLVASPTCENLAAYLYDALQLLAYACPPRTLTHSIRVWETDRLFAEAP
jgi:6-pyruvoyltetrahydropterin/6-carboxytetrahydropterin synthase